MVKAHAYPCPLSARQRVVYEIIDDHVRQHGYVPAIRTIQEKMGLRSGTPVVAHLRALERKGWLERDPGLARALRLIRPLVDSSPRGLLARAGQLAAAWREPGIATLTEAGWDGPRTGWWLLELEVGNVAENESLLQVLEPAFIEACWQSSARGGRHIYSWGPVPTEERARPALRIVEPSANDVGLVAGAPG